MCEMVMMNHMKTDRTISRGIRKYIGVAQIKMHIWSW